MSTITLSDAKTHLARILAEVAELGERYVITRSGRPAGILLSVEEYDGLVETLEILADPELSDAIHCGLAEASDRNFVSHTELWDELDG